MSISSVQEIVADIKVGRMVILVDEEDRENEGDLVLAAEHVTPEAINFMAKWGRGLICLTLTEARCRQLDLPLMVRDNKTPHGTAFTVSIEAAEGVTTGISAHDRSRTVQAAVARHASAADLVQPGHIFPLMAGLPVKGVGTERPSLNRTPEIETGVSVAATPSVIKSERRPTLPGLNPPPLMVSAPLPGPVIATADEIARSQLGGEVP